MREHVHYIVHYIIIRLTAVITFLMIRNKEFQLFSLVATEHSFGENILVSPVKSC